MKRCGVVLLRATTRSFTGSPVSNRKPYLLATQAYVEARRRGQFRAARTKQTARVADLAATQLHIERNPSTVEAVGFGGIRTTTAVPMLKENELVGSSSIAGRFDLSPTSRSIL